MAAGLEFHVHDAVHADDALILVVNLVNFQWNRGLRGNGSGQLLNWRGADFLVVLPVLLLALHGAVPDLQARGACLRADLGAAEHGANHDGFLWRRRRGDLGEIGLIS